MLRLLVRRRFTVTIGLAMVWVYTSLHILHELSRNPIHFETNSFLGKAPTNVDVQQQRRHQFMSTCSENVTGSVDRIIQYSNVSYCITHKIASTFWIRIFRYLHNDTTKGHVDSPFNISKYDTHMSKYKYIKEISMNNQTESSILKSFRFMFVREPYTRLWSVYVDKFILPDNYFWRTYGRQIKQLRSSDEDQTLCNQVSFPEFLNFVVESGSLDGSKLDDHFRPVHYGCDPCKFRPDFIGKLETMGTDSKEIFRKLSVSWLTKESRFKEEIHMLIAFSYRIVNFIRQCVTFSELNQRLWNVFQINGYIPADAVLPTHGTSLNGKDRFFEHVWNTFKTMNRSTAAIMEQREQMKVQAYREVSLKTLKGIQRIFRRDFTLFNYDSQPKDIFSQYDPT